MLVMNRLRATNKLIQVPDDVLELLARLKQKSPDKTYAIASLAINNLFNKALKQLDDESIFVLTGDIEAMWLRDSTWQMRPLLAAANTSGEIEQVIAQVSRRQTQFILIDPYANAFNTGPNDFHWHKDFPDQSPWVFERKFELDSIAAFWDLALRLYRVTNYNKHLDDDFWLATTKCLELIRAEQDHIPASHVFIRNDAPKHDYLSHEGKGAPFKPTGLVWSGFRPSDDACVLPYHIPANLHLTVVLGWLAECSAEFSKPEITNLAEKLKNDIELGITKYGLIGDRYAYEVDGLGNQIDLDDPNVPSLLSLPYLNVCSVRDQRYSTTREFILSSQHKMFVKGKITAGISSIHTPVRNIWPLAIAIQGLTASTHEEAVQCLENLELLAGATLHNHESVNVDDVSDYTRPWFSWADMTYFHLALKVAGLSEQADFV